ncbi:Peroxiredoxin OsmC [Thermoflexales bacterium]|nr:Peroxiredoxin OsmC [Thermoflexales bacterium]
MADILRTALTTWTGNLKDGSGVTSGESGYLHDVKVTWSARFENQPGTNPEELIAAAEASCYSMALASSLTKQDTPPEVINTKATLTMRRDDSGTKLTRLHLDVEARVPGVDETRFAAIAEATKEGCPVSVLLKPGLEELTVSAKLLK